MAGRKKRAFLGRSVRSPRIELEREDLSKAEIEALLDDIVDDWLGEGRRIMGGWMLMGSMDVGFIEVGDAKIPCLNEARSAELIELAGTNCHAFDLAQYVAAMQIAILKANGIDMCPSLTLFGAEILSGERVRPTQKGRPLGSDASTRVWQYTLCRSIVGTTTLRLAKSDASCGLESFCACDAVADAFCRAGRHTTYSQIKSICFDPGYKDVRDLADYIGLTGDY